MEEAAARAKLEDMVAASTFPTLSTEQVDRLLAEAKRTDKDGHAPDDDDWSGLYDLNYAAAAGWRIKAGMTSNRHSFGSNQGNYNPEQVFEHCMKMADHYAAKQVSSILLASDRWSGTGRLNAAHYEDAV
jgi:hypothetical protein